MRQANRPCRPADATVGPRRQGATRRSPARGWQSAGCRSACPARAAAAPPAPTSPGYAAPAPDPAGPTPARRDGCRAMPRRSEQRRQRQVVSLHGGAIHHPALRPASVRQMPDEPMAGQADCDPHRNAPDEPGRAARPEQPRRPRQLRRHPGCFQPAHEPVAHQRRLRRETGRVGQRQPAMHLPPRVEQPVAAMRVQVVPLICRCAQSLVSCSCTMPRGPAMPTNVPRYIITQATHRGAATLPWIDMRCSPIECPAHSVTALVARNGATAPGVVSARAVRRPHPGCVAIRRRGVWPGVAGRRLPAAAGVAAVRRAMLRRAGVPRLAHPGKPGAVNT